MTHVIRPDARCFGGQKVNHDDRSRTARDASVIRIENVIDFVARFSRWERKTVALRRKVERLGATATRNYTNGLCNGGTFG